MSGLALVAHALGASVTGSDRAAGSAYGGPLRAAGIEPAIGHDAANVPGGAEVVVSTRDPARQPRAGGCPRARPARAAPRRPARRADPAAPDDRRHRHARQDDDVEHARPRAARLRHGSGVPRRRRRPLDGVERRLGSGGVARGRGRRVRPLAAQARAGDRGAHQRRARPPHDLRVPARRRRDVPRVPRPRRSRRGRLGPARAARARPAGAPARPVRRRARADPGRLALHARRRRGRADRAGHAQRPQRRGGADRRAARRRRPGDGRRRAARLPGRRPALRAAGDEPGGARWWSTTTRTIPPRSPRRSRRRARSARAA